MKTNSRRMFSIFAIVVITAAILTGCSGVKSQKAVIFLNDATTDGRPIKGNLNIYGADKKPIAYGILKKAAEAEDASKKSNKLEYIEECDGGAGCFYVDGKPRTETLITDYYEPEEGFEVQLPINEQGKAVMRISDGKNSAEWRFTPGSPNETIYINILVSDFWVSVTELEDGKTTYTSVEFEDSQTEQTDAFLELYPEESAYYFERENPWIPFRLMFTNYSRASSDAYDATCEVFGSDCNGTASYSSIARVNREAHDDIIVPMRDNLMTYSENKDVSIALLKLEKMANLLVSCYFRAYSAADDRNEDAYRATSECFSDVQQQRSDLEIYLKEFSQELTGFMIAGYY